MESLSSERRGQEQVSVLDALGDGITGIAWPVSLCMAITIFLVRNSDGILCLYLSTLSLTRLSLSQGARPQSARQQQLFDRFYSTSRVSRELECA